MTNANAGPVQRPRIAYAGLVTLTDRGYQASEHANIVDRGKNKPESQKEANRVHARLDSRSY